MNSTDTSLDLLKGGQFLVKKSDAGQLFIPEDFSEEQHMIRETVKSFVEQEIYPVVDRIEKLEEGLIPSLLEKFADLGMLGTHMPEAYGGSDLDFITNTLIGEEIGPSGSFSVTYNAHTGIGMLPLLYFGTEDQKQKFLPGLVSGKLKASYCLTEPSSGSDALAARTTAIPASDGTHYVLNGQKMWITNAGFADLLTVFAQVDGDKFTGFIVDAKSEGISMGAEEKKLGIKGSSTRQVFFENVRVPMENVLGEVGKGHHIAFNVLNTGRFKLGASVLGGAKKVCSLGIDYALERHQFDQPIGHFGAIKYKLAEQAIRIFATESALYRTAQLIQSAEENGLGQGVAYGKAKLDAAEEYVIESSILKIVGSEVLDYVVDETVQIFGGMGYSEEGVIARAYRDSRINRIFEGTNEINRMLILNAIFKRAMKGQLDLLTPGMALQQELMQDKPLTSVEEGPFADEMNAVDRFKKVLIMILGTAAQDAMSGKMDLKTEQEILMNMSDIIIDIFCTESALLRVIKMQDDASDKDLPVYQSIIKTQVHDASARITKNATDAIASFIPADMQSVYISGLRKLMKYPLQNVKENRRVIADRLLADRSYRF
jgi:alkylation response protein AidB-like acyl-CoA dehydrogenase